MILVAVFAKTGFFDYLALKVRSVNISRPYSSIGGALHQHRRGQVSNARSGLNFSGLSCFWHFKYIKILVLPSSVNILFF